MDKKKARQFLEELNSLQEKYGLYIVSNYNEEIDYNYDEEPYVSGVSSHLTLVDENGFEVTFDEIEMGYSNCYYCGRRIESDDNFCNVGCKSKFNKLNT